MAYARMHNLLYEQVLAEVFIHELFHYGPWDDEHDNFADYSPVGDLGSIGPKHKANLELILQLKPVQISVI